MNRVWMAVALGTLGVACQVGPAPVADARSIAAIEALTPWDGRTPAPAPGQVLADLPDWRGEGSHVAVLVDAAQGQIVWAATVPDAELPKFRAGNVVGQIGDCCRPPPCGCRTCCRAESVASHLIGAVQDHSTAQPGFER